LAIRFGGDSLFKQSTKIARQPAQVPRAFLASITGGAST
jgi:hypothetical protein